MVNRTKETIEKWISELDYTNVIKVINEGIKTIRDEMKGYEKLVTRGGLVELKDTCGKMLVIGDIHGDLDTLLKILNNESVIDNLDRSQMYLVFLGDYIDRGDKSLEAMVLALKLKINYPDRVILLRGNHEGPDDLIAHPHTFPYELSFKFGERAQEIYTKFRELFNSMPHAAITYNGIVMLHGGVPTEINDINDLIRARELHPQYPHLTEILWNDPDETGIKGAYPSPRGAGKIFGADCTEHFLKIVNGKIILRGHEATVNGYKISHKNKIITLFSRLGPPYWNLKAAYVLYDLEKPIEKLPESIKLIE